MYIDSYLTVFDLLYLIETYLDTPFSIDLKCLEFLYYPFKTNKKKKKRCLTQDK